MIYFLGLTVYLTMWLLSVGMAINAYSIENYTWCAVFILPIVAFPFLIFKIVQEWRDGI